MAVKVEFELSTVIMDQYCLCESRTVNELLGSVNVEQGYCLGKSRIRNLDSSNKHTEGVMKETQTVLCNTAIDCYSLITGES